MPHTKHSSGWPSVTEILSPFDLRWYKWFIKKYGTVEAAEKYAKARAESGTRVHNALEVLVKSKVIEEAKTKVREDEESCVDRLKLYFELLGIEIVASEREMQSEKYKYHGCLDLLVKINNPSLLPAKDFWGTPMRLEPGVLAIADLKTTESGKVFNDGQMKKHAMQTSAYGHMVAENDGVWPELGLILQVDLNCDKVMPACAYPLKKWFGAFLIQRENYDLINNKGNWEKTKSA